MIKSNENATIEARSAVPAMALTGKSGIAGEALIKSLLPTNLLG